MIDDEIAERARAIWDGPDQFGSAAWQRWLETGWLTTVVLPPHRPEVDPII